MVAHLSNLTRTLAPLNFQVRIRFRHLWYVVLDVVLSGSHVGFSISGAITQFRLRPNKTRTAQRTFANRACMWGMGSALAKFPSFGTL